MKKKESLNLSGTNDKLFPVVAIGASAGGLEAYQELIDLLPSNTGMAYVIIQHMSPNYKSMLRDILLRHTRMEVFNIKNEMKPAENRIYIVPPNYEVTIVEGIFHLKVRQKSKKVFMPIDIFMRSLAEDHLHFAIGVILSGTDSDGVMGMEYIKTSGGITYAQDRSTAKFFEMPHNSIKAGVVDFVLSPPAIARELKRISANVNTTLLNKYTDGFSDDANEHISRIFVILKNHKNIDFKHYKPTTVRRRILRRMMMNKISDIRQYVNFLNSDVNEVEELCEDILINVTSFFRDPGMYESLKKNVFPKIMKNRSPSEPVRIWVTACSTGEEAYSMAIALVEYLGEKISTYQVQIFSTDLSDSGIDKARAGIYPEDIKTDVSEERLRKFFIKTDSKYQINKNIRDLCVFAKQDLIQDPPFSRIDLISCRNVLIYLGSVLQNKVIPVFHYALKTKGFLVLGSSETVGMHRHLFELIDKKNRLYVKKPLSANSAYDFSIHEMFTNRSFQEDNPKMIGKTTKPVELQKDIESIILKKYSPASVIINKQLEVIHFKGNLEPYLEIPDGAPTNNVLKMVRQGLSMDLKFLIHESFKKNKLIRKNNIEYIHETSEKNINVIIEPYADGATKAKYRLILFEENGKTAPIAVTGFSLKRVHASDQKKKDAEFSKMSRELATSKEHLQAVIEQQETTNEELRSANEEIQSSNEELQSTNEELETTKEELQSTNEELTTVNEELSNRNMELSSVNSDLNNLLSSIKISIVMVDNNLRIKKYTNDASKLLNLIQGDIGRKITDINPNVEINNLSKILNEVIDTPVIREMEVKDNNDCWYSMKVRPYKTMENKIDGAILTFIDITDIKKYLNEQEMHKNEILKLNTELEKNVNERTRELEKINKNLENEINERTNAEKSLRLLSKSLVDSQETERIKLSRELHDGVNQILMAAKLKMHNVEKGIKKYVKNQKSIDEFNDAQKYLIGAIDEVRRLSHSLRPSALDIGIGQSLNSLIQDFSNRSGVNVIFKHSKLIRRYTEDIELSLYRILQEALHNIEKHSKATNVKVFFGQQKNFINLSIADNGKGFTGTKLRSKATILHKLGLVGLKERAESVGGKFLIKTEVGLGTIIEVKIPVSYKKECSKTKK